MKRAGGKNPGRISLNDWCRGFVLGGFIGTLTADMPGFAWLNYGQSFGFDNPIVLNLGILVITFALNIKITIASIIGLVISAIIYRFL